MIKEGRHTPIRVASDEIDVLLILDHHVHVNSLPLTFNIVGLDTIQLLMSMR